MAVRKRSLGFRLVVDPVRCDGFGHCHELAPELVALDEWGYPIITSTVSPGNDRELLRSAQLAVRGCPRTALVIERLSAQ
jgi:ferredoxin